MKRDLKIQGSIGCISSAWWRFLLASVFGLSFSFEADAARSCYQYSGPIGTETICIQGNSYTMEFRGKYACGLQGRAQVQGGGRQYHLAKAKAPQLCNDGTVAYTNSGKNCTIDRQRNLVCKSVNPRSRGSYTYRLVSGPGVDAASASVPGGERNVPGRGGDPNQGSAYGSPSTASRQPSGNPASGGDPLVDRSYEECVELYVRDSYPYARNVCAFDITTKVMEAGGDRFGDLFDLSPGEEKFLRELGGRLLVAACRKPYQITKPGSRFAWQGGAYECRRNY